MANGNNKLQFTIEEEEASDEAVRVYGSTKESSPLKANGFAGSSEDSPRVRVHDPQHRLKTPSEDSASRDSDNLMRGTDSSSGEPEFDPSQPFWKHPKVRSNWKILLAATALTIVGLFLLTLATVVTVRTSFAQGVIFYIAGAICFIPGFYHVVYVYLAVKGRRGFYFYHLPLFN